MKNNGLYQAVVPIKSALDILEIFSNMKILILGGDLYERDNYQTFLNAYCDWYYEGDCYLDSIETARNYLFKLEEEPLFVFGNGFVA